MRVDLEKTRLDRFPSRTRDLGYFDSRTERRSCVARSLESKLVEAAARTAPAPAHAESSSSSSEDEDDAPPLRVRFRVMLYADEEHARLVSRGKLNMEN